MMIAMANLALFLREGQCHYRLFHRNSYSNAACGDFFMNISQSKFVEGHVWIDPAGRINTIAAMFLLKSV